MRQTAGGFHHEQIADIEAELEMRLKIVAT